MQVCLDRHHLDAIFSGVPCPSCQGVNVEEANWEVETLEDAKVVINILHRRSIRDFHSIEAMRARVDILSARAEYLMCPRWRFLDRSILKKQIRYAEARNLD